MFETKKILMVAAESDALPHAKVGGIADVLRDVPRALARVGCTVNVVLPDYGLFSQLPSSEELGTHSVNFSGCEERVLLYKTIVRTDHSTDLSVNYWVLNHPYFSPCGTGNIYCNDPDDRPFATDASKYAFFCAAVAQIISDGGFGELDVLHLHDWHAALLLVLREFDPRYEKLKSLRTVYSIHNLSLQGVRPLDGDNSSLHRWFPGLSYQADRIVDPENPHCINPMRAGINLSDKVHAVSPNYAKEIQKPSDKLLGVYGGEGLEHDLNKANTEGRLVGILNGCEYPQEEKYRKIPKAKLAYIIREAIISWAASTPLLESCQWVARERLQVWAAKKERGFLVTSVGRLTEQKMQIFKASAGLQKKSALEMILKDLDGIGIFILLGSGSVEYQKFLLDVAGRHSNFIYLQGYNEQLASALYASGDLFLMPSSFEPCGISQMLAMRAGQPCLVNEVGGLKDTVQDGVDGFSFHGKGLERQAHNFVKHFQHILNMKRTNASLLSSVAKAAQERKFSWDESAKKYIELLY